MTFRLTKIFRLLGQNDCTPTVTCRLKTKHFLALFGIKGYLRPRLMPFAGDKAAAVLPRETAGEFFPALLGFLYLHGRTIFAECSHNFSR